MYPPPSVTNVRKMLESCDNRARREKRKRQRFYRHAEWSHVAATVIEAKKHSEPRMGRWRAHGVDTQPPCENTYTLTGIFRMESRVNPIWGRRLIRAATLV